MVLLCVFLQIAVEPLISGFQLAQVLFLCKGAVIQPVLKVFRMQLIGADVEVKCYTKVVTEVANEIY